MKDLAKLPLLLIILEETTVFSPWCAFSPRRHFSCQWWQCNNPLWGKKSEFRESCGPSSEKQHLSPGKMCHSWKSIPSSPGSVISSASPCTNDCPQDVKGPALSFLLVSEMPLCYEQQFNLLQPHEPVILLSCYPTYHLLAVISFPSPGCLTIWVFFPCYSGLLLLPAPAMDLTLGQIFGLFIIVSKLMTCTVPVPSESSIPMWDNGASSRFKTLLSD